MEKRFFHGLLTPVDIARAIVGEFNRGNFRTQQVGNDEGIIVQIATREQVSSGGKTALTVTLRSVADGITVEIGKQSWLGVAASLGQSAFWALRNPWALLDRLDDIAQDIENLQLVDEIWRLIEDTARSLGATYELSEKFRRIVCEYCLSANPVGEASCLACGAPLGRVQISACPKCGFILGSNDEFCQNCGYRKKIR